MGDDIQFHIRLKEHFPKQNTPKRSIGIQKQTCYSWQNDNIVIILELEHAKNKLMFLTAANQLVYQQAS